LAQHTKTGKNIPDDHKLYEIVTKYTRWPYTLPNGHKIYQYLPLQDPPKFIQIGIFGLKIYHLVTLIYFSLFAGEENGRQKDSKFDCGDDTSSRERCYNFKNIFANIFGEKNDNFLLKVLLVFANF
jgi:hypothetical protein